MHLCYRSFSCISFLQTSFSKQFHPVQQDEIATSCRQLLGARFCSSAMKNQDSGCCITH